MKQALILHGTDATPASNWFAWLKVQLEQDGYAVWLPQLPNSDKPNAKTYNQFLLANQDFEFNNETIIIGHSSGAVEVLSLLQHLPEDKKVKAVGENSFKQIEVRILAATHKNLDLLIKQNLFREDLYYRLNVISINAPPLRERPEDISLLAMHFLSKFSLAHKSCAKSFSPQALEYLLQHKWPGNIRELENLIERAVILCRGEEIREGDLHGTESDILAAEGTPSEIIQKFSNSGYLTLNDFVMCYIDFILGKTGGKKEKAARILQIDRSTLHRKLIEHGRASQNHGKNVALNFMAQSN
jgi:two-component system response regulator HydG